jgi:hypothetical protein
MQRDISRQARAERTRGGHGGEITIKNHFASAEEDNCASDTQGNSREYERWGVCTQPRRLARPEPHSLQEGDTGKGEVAQAHEQWRLRRSLLTLTLLPFLKLFICVSPRERETQRACRFDLNGTRSSELNGKGHRPNASGFRFRCQRNGANGLAVASGLARDFRASQLISCH